jgi:hypothetical protein
MMTTGDEAIESDHQHVKPCHDCPWARRSIPTWLGGSSVDTWLAAAHGETVIMCHCIKNQQCAGASIFRSNVCKLPRPPNIVLESDEKLVFATDYEFIDHHRKEKLHERYAKRIARTGRKQRKQSRSKAGKTSD